MRGIVRKAINAIKVFYLKKMSVHEVHFIIQYIFLTFCLKTDSLIDL